MTLTDAVSEPPGRDPAGVRAALCDADRVRVLTETGLGAELDPVLEAIAQRTSRLMRVPVALVSLVTPDAQVFAGMAGLTGEAGDRRSTPLTMSLCQYVVATSRPLIITDARTDERARGTLAPAELGVVGYAGFPLTDSTGLVLGALCAIDTQPRTWSADELDLLEGMAQGCSAELRLRIAARDVAREKQSMAAAEARLRRVHERRSCC